MNVRVLSTTDAAEWDVALTGLPGADIYHTAGYHAAHETNGDGQARAFVVEDGGIVVLFYPFLLRPVPGTDYSDIETVYGYSGPVTGAALFSTLEPAWQAFGNWCQDEKVIAEFVRLHPLNDWPCLPLEYNLRNDRQTVVVDLEGTSGDMWKRYPTRGRNMVRKAEMGGLVADELPLSTMGDPLGIFAGFYREHMGRLGATDYYLFSDAYFWALAAGLGARLKMFVAQDCYKIVASALIMSYGDRLHYHLSWRRDEYKHSGAGNLLLHQVALWGQENGYKWLHLGGGRDAADDDSLLLFKSAMSRERRQFRVATRIHDAVAYEALCAQWRAANPGVDAGNFFPLYRKAVAH